MRVIYNNFVFVTLIGISSFQFGYANDVTCTLNPIYNLNENGTEVTATVLNTDSGDDDGYYALNFAEGNLENCGELKAWCIDLERRIGFKDYEVDIFSSLQPDLFTTQYPDAVDKPQFIPAINWLINNYTSGTEVTVPDCVTNHSVTDREFQLAVWTLIDDETDPASFFPGEAEECVIAFLVQEAIDSGPFVPDCTNLEQKIGLIIVVDDADLNVLNQVLITEVDIAKTDICECNGNPIVEGDPHFKTWAGENYDFHGVCDLVWLKNPKFRNGLGMDIHMRTARMGMWSYVSNAAIRIGEDIFEIVGGEVEKNFWINGVAKETAEISNTELQMELASTISGFPIYFKETSSKQREFVIDLGESELIVFKTWKSFVSVQVQKAKHNDFKNSVGLVGSFPQGTKLARDNISVVGEADAFGQEWQVLASEKNLFHNIVGPQHPEHCEIPSHVEMRRRLLDSIVTIERAEKACTNVDKDAMDLCVFDVMATNDELTAGAY